MAAVKGTSAPLSQTATGTAASSFSASNITVSPLGPSNNLSPSASIQSGPSNLSSWSVPQSWVPLPTATNADALGRIALGQAPSVGPTNWADPFFASDSWVADSWMHS